MITVSQARPVPSREVTLAAPDIKRGSAWKESEIVVHSCLMIPVRDEEALRLAREVADAVAAGDHDAAVQLVRRLEARLTGARNRKPRAEGPEAETLAFAARPSIVPVRRRPEPTGSARQAVVAALAEIGVPCRAKL